MSATDDVARAVATQWDAAGMGASVPGGLHLDELPRDGTVPLAPYATFTVQKDRKSKSAVRSFTEYTRVALEVFGTGVLGAVISAVHAAFAWPDVRLDLSFAADVFHVYTERGLTEDEGATAYDRNGQRLRRERVAFVIWTQRLRG